MGSNKINLNDKLPKLWVLHNMPRSGGTLVSKCFGSMASSLLLSEIHPYAQHVAAFNALNQAQKWYGLLPDLNWQKTEFVDAIGQIQSVVKKDQKQLILRDWSYVDYLDPPVPNKPKGKPALINALSPFFSIQSIQLVRHPLDTWLSLRRLKLIESIGMNLQQFLKAYRCYLENTKSDFRLVYEEFIRSPGQQLELACHKTGLIYDESCLDKWFDFANVTGDTSNASSLREKATIEYRARRSSADIDQDWLINQADYKFIISEIYG